MIRGSARRIHGSLYLQNLNIFLRIRVHVGRVTGIGYLRTHKTQPTQSRITRTASSKIQPRNQHNIVSPIVFTLRIASSDV